MSAGGNRTYVVLALDEDDDTWLRQFLVFERCPIEPKDGWSDGYAPGNWYRIPLVELRKQWNGVTIVFGAISISIEEGREPKGTRRLAATLARRVREDGGSDPK